MQRRSHRSLVLSLCALACAAAAALSLWPRGSPVRTEDQNRDGRPDVWREYDRQGQLTKVAVDTNFDGRSDVHEYYERGALVRRESEKKARHIPLRKLLAQAPHVLTALCPCWMASPLSVSQLLDATQRYFDVVIFDEASQVLPEDAVASLLRGSRAIIAGVQNPHLRALLDAFMDDEKIARLYRTAPAAKTVHHAFLGGLLEHVLSVCHLCRMTASHYKDIDLDLLLAGAILHDVGKISELTYERAFGYSTDGQLLGHIMIGMQMLHDKICGVPDFAAVLMSGFCRIPRAPGKRRSGAVLGERDGEAESTVK